MRYVAAYLLAALGGNASPSAKDIEKILSSVGVESDKALIEKVIGELKGKDLEEVLAAGMLSLISIQTQLRVCSL